MTLGPAPETGGALHFELPFYEKWICSKFGDEIQQEETILVSENSDDQISSCDNFYNSFDKGVVVVEWGTHLFCDMSQK